MRTLQGVAAVSAPLVFLCALLIAGAMAGEALPGISHAATPIAVLGVRGVPGAWLFNGGTVCAGLLAAIALTAVRAAVPAGLGWRVRIGARLLPLAALAFAAQGLLPLDADDLDGPGAALRGMAWTLWWLTSVIGAGQLLSVGRGGVIPALHSRTALLPLGIGLSLLAPWVGSPWAPSAAVALLERGLPLAWLGWACVLALRVRGRGVPD